MDSDRPPQDDWLAELRAAWREGPEPASDRPLAEEDLHTRLAVDWMRQAWLALPVPAASAPRVPAATRSIRWRFAAAAALLLALGLPLAIGAWRRTHRTAASAAPPAPVAGPLAPTAPTAPAVPPETAATIVAIDEHHLELRSGPVRLYLLTDPPPPHPEDLR